MFKNNLTAIRSIILLLLSLLANGILWAQAPSYYDNIDLELEQEALREQLQNLVTNTQHTVLPYTAQNTTDVRDAIKMTDKDLEQENYLLLIYGYDDEDNDPRTDRTRWHNSYCNTDPCPEGTWNREHVYPRSLGTPNLGFQNAGSDIHALRAIDQDMNMLRSNRLFDDGEGHAHLTLRGLFYPGDEWKGDVARMMMFMYLRYPEQCVATNVGYGSTSYSPLGDMPNIFLEWNADDPVSEIELIRNDIAEDLQGNRNPFIDNPALATLIWGGPRAEDTWNILDTPYFEKTTYSLAPTVTNTETCLSQATTADVEYIVYSMTGKQLNSNKLNRCIDFSTYESGVYFVKLQDHNNTQTFKIVVP